jgi:hypothetical protein
LNAGNSIVGFGPHSLAFTPEDVVTERPRFCAGSGDPLEIVRHALARFIRVVHDDPRGVDGSSIDIVPGVDRGTLGKAQRLR